jgi:hypothetical protein
MSIKKERQILTSKHQIMIKNKQQFSPVLVLICSFIILLMARCSGPMGPQGIPGVDGQNGQDGQDGISLAYSAIYDINASEWTGSVDGYRVSLDVPEITDDIYYNGAVLVYRLIEIDPKSFNLLPYTYVDNSLTVYMDYDTYVGNIDLSYKEVFEGANDTPAITDLMSFKVVIIEGIPLATVKNMVNVKDLGAVTRKFNIQTDTSIH